MSSKDTDETKKNVDEDESRLTDSSDDNPPSTIDADPEEASARIPDGEKQDPASLESNPDQSDASTSSSDTLGETGIGDDPNMEATSANSGASTAEEVVEDPIEEHEEEAGWSFAAKFLSFLLILLAGAALGIWGGPKLAPLLPSGMAPVAEWLSPGQSATEARIDSLAADLEAQKSAASEALASVPTAADISAAVSASASDLESRLSDQIANQVEALRAEIPAEQDQGEFLQRLSRLESAVEGRAAELAEIKEQIGDVSGSSEGMSAEALAQIDLYRGELEGIRAELGVLSDNVSSQRARIDDVAATADRSIERAQEQVTQIEQEAAARMSAADVESDLAAIRAALAAGVPFEDPVARLSGAPDMALPEALSTTAASGAPTLATLRDQYPQAAHAAIRATILAEGGEGLLGRAGSFVEAQFASRSLTPQEGTDTDAVLSRMEDRLANGDLGAVLTEAEALPEPALAAEPMAVWLDGAARRHQAETALEDLSGALPATN